MRPAYDGYFEEADMPQQHFLDLARVDVRSAADDHVLGAVAQREIALLVEAPEIPGM